MEEEQFYTILTNIGKAKIANATLLNSNVTLTTLKVGDGNGAYYNPTEDQKDLKNTVYTCAVGSISIDENNPNWVVVETIIPGSVGGFTIREVGLFDTDGDMIAIGKYPETYKPVVANGASKDLSVRTIFEVSNADNVTLSINPSVIIATKEDINNLQEQINEHKEEYTELKEDVEELSNSNLLINSDFRIWQRGESFEYNLTSGGKYIADRWRISYGKADKISFNGGTALKLSNISKDYELNFEQLIENIQNLKEKTLMLSWEAITNVDCIINSLFFARGQSQGNKELATKNHTYKAGQKIKQAVTVTIPNDLPNDYDFLGVRPFRITNTDGVEITVLNVKLEIGDKTTPFYPKSITLEEIMCKRYYRRLNIKNNTYAPIGTFTIQGGATIGRLNIPLPVNTRIQPTIELKGTLLAGKYTIANLSADQVSDGYIRLQAQISESATETYSSECLTSSAESDVILDAEIY